MKKSLLMFVFMLVLLFSTFANTSATLSLVGTIQEIYTVTLVQDATQEYTALNLNLNSRGTDVNVGTLVSFSNGGLYDLSAVSANDFRLRKDTDFAPYSLTINGVTFNAGSAGGSFTPTLLSFEHEFDILLNYNLPGSQPAGSYSDTVTFTITAN